jgi:hypothetical protein
VTAKGDLEWLAPLSFLISGIPLILIAYPATLQESGLMDRDTAAGFTMVTLLITLGALIWGEDRVACPGLAILVILPAAWLYLRTRRRRPVGA